MGKDKLKKFADIGRFENVFEPSMKQMKEDSFPMKGKWGEKFFGNSNPITLELACGKGEYTVGLARMFPDRNFIGVDIKGARIWRGAKTGVEENQKNVAFVRGRIDFIESYFAENEVAEIWITFPDPQTRKNNVKKRLTGPIFLNRYQKILEEGGTINLKSDSTFFYDFTNEVTEQHQLTIHENSADVYGDFVFNTKNKTLAECMEIKTFYENMWLAEGKKIKFISFDLDKYEPIG